MENITIQLLKKEFDITGTDIKILLKNSKQLTRNERRHYFQNIKLREKEYKKYLQKFFSFCSSEEKEDLHDKLLENLLYRGGEPCIADKIMMDAVGRIETYRCLREKAENRGIKLNALTNFGGIGLVISLIGIITAAILYFFIE
ncbi:MAG: hypothetical protein K9L17_04615 [Clostridiales bacterium]|nr:hypothetical protein [Clostridiales bacterium]MCF8021958.1 hypothetical protein [Clostridiales bacterium]